MKKNIHNEKLSSGTKKGVAFRHVIRYILKFAKNECLQLHPELTEKERIIKAQEEPFWTAAKDCRELTTEEKKSLGLV